MKLQILQENFAKSLSIASRFTSAKAQLPVLANILLKTKKNKLVISATNLETSISLTIGAKIESGGELTVPAKTLTDLITNFKVGQVTLEAKKERLKIHTSGFKSMVSGMVASDFPDVPVDVGKGGLKILYDEFCQALSKTLFAVSIDETRPVLTGVLMIIKKSGLVLVSTDGFRLSQKKLSLKTQKDLKEGKVILPKNVLSEVSRINAEDEEILLSHQKKENQVIFGIDGVVLSSRVIEGSFPDFEKIIPKESKIELFLDKEELLQAVKLASVFAKDSANVLKLTIGKDSVTVSSESKAYGSQVTEVDAKVDGSVGKDFQIAFNYRFLEDYLNAVDGENIKVKLSDPNAPALFLDDKDKDFLHIIMPVKLQS